MRDGLISLGRLLRRLLARRGAALSLAFLVLVGLAATFAELLPPDPLAQSIADSLKPPSPETARAASVRSRNRSGSRRNWCSMAA